MLADFFYIWQRQISTPVCYFPRILRGIFYEGFSQWNIRVVDKSRESILNPQHNRLYLSPGCEGNTSMRSIKRKLPNINQIFTANPAVFATLDPEYSTVLLIIVNFLHFRNKTFYYFIFRLKLLHREYFLLCKSLPRIGSHMCSENISLHIHFNICLVIMMKNLQQLLWFL